MTRSASLEGDLEFKANGRKAENDDVGAFDDVLTAREKYDHQHVANRKVRRNLLRLLLTRSCWRERFARTSFYSQVVGVDDLADRA